jgi:hypothetical protein
VFERFLNCAELDDDINSVWDRVTKNNADYILRLYAADKLKSPEDKDDLKSALDLCSLDVFKLVWSKHTTVCGYYNFPLYKIQNCDVQKQKCTFVLTDGIKDDNVRKTLINRCSIWDLITLHYYCDIDPDKVCKFLNHTINPVVYQNIKTMYKKSSDCIQYIVDAYNSLHPNSVTYNQGLIAFNQTVYQIDCDQFTILRDTDFMYATLFEKEEKKYTVTYTADGDVVMKDDDGNTFKMGSEELLPDVGQKRLRHIIRDMKPKKSAN